jgi:ring-1,2-phenylacetyl-CoA epoxidase subunit PaaB
MKGAEVMEETVEFPYVSYEVFVQYQQLEHHRHVGSVLAASADVALQLARENFLRRDDAVSIWVAPTSQITMTQHGDADFFAREFDRDYRRVDGYSDNARRWKAFKQKSLEFEDVVQDVSKEEV